MVSGGGAVHGPDWLHPFHLLAAEVFLIYAPFGKVGHVVTLFISRIFHGAESARRGVKP